MAPAPHTDTLYRNIRFSIDAHILKMNEGKTTNIIIIINIILINQDYYNVDSFNDIKILRHQSIDVFGI